MTKVRIDDAWYIIDDAVAKRMEETARELVDAYKDVARLRILLEREVTAVTQSLPNNQDANWRRYCKENNINC